MMFCGFRMVFKCFVEKEMHSTHLLSSNVVHGIHWIHIIAYLHENSAGLASSLFYEQGVRHCKFLSLSLFCIIFSYKELFCEWICFFFFFFSFFVVNFPQRAFRKIWKWFRNNFIHKKHKVVSEFLKACTAYFIIGDPVQRKSTESVWILLTECR